MNACLSGNIVDVVAGRIFRGHIRVSNGRIGELVEDPDAVGENWYTPGLVDAHVHIESSLLAPSEFARAAVSHGTVASVSDPHEIANVLGVEGVLWMLANGRQSPFKFCFGAPSCVPATGFETAGAVFTVETVSELLDTEGISYLAEVMNFPAVIQGDPDFRAMIAAASKRGLPVDGHAPGLMGEGLKKYVAAGIQTDHECARLEEAIARCRLGMKIAIREGTAARNFEALWPMLKSNPAEVFFCSDDKHPDDLELGHINQLCARSVSKGVDLMTVLRAATLNPVRHYSIPAGLLQPGDPADFVEWTNLTEFNPQRCWINGCLVVEGGQSLLPRIKIEPVNRFAAKPRRAEDFSSPRSRALPVIGVRDGQLLTDRLQETAADYDLANDILRIAVVNRYSAAPVATAWIHGFGLKAGAIASSVAHDSHNIVAVGCSDEALARAVNAVIEERGGLSIATDQATDCLPLPIAGLMSCWDCKTVAAEYRKISQQARVLGSSLQSPFMTLSFMALLVIPSLKISDLGLFDGERFQFVEQSRD